MSERGEDYNSSIWLDGEERWEGPLWGSLVGPGSSISPILSNNSFTLWLLEEEVRGENTPSLPTVWNLREEQLPWCEIIPPMLNRYISYGELHFIKLVSLITCLKFRQNTNNAMKHYIVTLTYNKLSVHESTGLYFLLIQKFIQ